MSALYVCIYRLYSAMQSCFEKVGVSRKPRFLQRAKRKVRQLVERIAFPKHRLPLRVRDGLSRGLWICARLPEESSYWQGKRERFTEQAILATVHEGAVVYDVGAHIGIVAFGMARLVGERGRVVAFDGDPENIASLRESCVLNRFEERVQVVHAAVWSHCANQGIPFRCGAIRRSHGGVAADGYAPVLGDGITLTVPATTLDAFIASNGPIPELVKIDVEGGEYEVLRGGEMLFKRERPRILVEVHHADAFERISVWMEKSHYSAQWNIPKAGFPRMLYAWPSESPPCPHGRF